MADQHQQPDPGFDPLDLRRRLRLAASPAAPADPDGTIDMDDPAAWGTQHPSGNGLAPTNPSARTPTPTDDEFTDIDEIHARAAHGRIEPTGERAD